MSIRQDRRGPGRSLARRRRASVFAFVLMVVIGGLSGGRQLFSRAQSRQDVAARLAAAFGRQEGEQMEEEGEFGFLALEMVPGRPGMEEVVWGSLPPDRGWVAVLSRDPHAPGGWLRLSCSPELARIVRVQAVQPVPDRSPELLVETEYDARLGALSYTRQAHLFKWNESASSLVMIWQTTLWQETYSPELPFQRKLTLETRCQLLPGVISTRSTTREYVRQDVPSVHYQAVRENLLHQQFRWQPRAFRFVAEQE
ncbi:MAG: hypothetical protein IMX01_07130 [Limnochordaceae bacterium]|nr:hypothetical protein [Limnochordaceae bacterium]